MLRVRNLIDELKQFPEDHFVMVESERDQDGFYSGRLIVDIKPRMVAVTNIPVITLVPQDEELELV